MLQGMQRGQGSPGAVRADSPEQAQHSSGKAVHARPGTWEAAHPAFPLGQHRWPARITGPAGSMLSLRLA